MTGAGAVGVAIALMAMGQTASAQWYGRPYPYPYYPPPPAYYPYPPPPYYAPPSVEVPAPPRPSPAIAAVQRELATLGYDPGQEDGLFGPRVANAVAGFQRDHGLAVNGRLSGETIGAIHEAARSAGDPSVGSQSVPIPQPTNDAGVAAPPTNRPTLSVRPASP